MENGSTTYLPMISTTKTSHRKLQDIFERLRRASGELFEGRIQQELQTLYEKYQRNRLYLVLLGQFKRGKTSLLNSLIGVDLLPVGVLPVTSIVTIVRYGPDPLAHVRFMDGEFQDIVLEQLPAYVTERGNPGNLKHVREVEVMYPAPMLQDGLCLVDTPGIGSIFEQNTQVAYDFVPQADAAVFVFSPESPLTRTELEFLRHIRAYVQKVFFVLNKSDQVNDADRTEILEFAAQTIRQQVPAGELRFFAVSAKRALEARSGGDSVKLAKSQIPHLRDVLEQFVSAHRGHLLMQSATGTLQRMVRDALLKLELEERALATDLQDLKSKIEKIERAWHALDQRHREAAYVLRGEVAEFMSQLRLRLDEYAASASPALVKHMQETVRAHVASPKTDLVRTVDQELRQRIVDILEEWQIHLEGSVEVLFEALTSRFTREAAEIAEGIQQAAAEQFGFSWRAAPLPDRLVSESALRIRVEEVVTWGLTRFPLLLPKRIFVRYLQNWVGRSSREELSRHAGALRSDLSERLERSVAAYWTALDRQIDETRESIRAALNRAAALQAESETRTQASVEQQSYRLQFLRAADAELAELQAELRDAAVSEDKAR